MSRKTRSFPDLRPEYRNLFHGSFPLLSHHITASARNFVGLSSLFSLANQHVVSFAACGLSESTPFLQISTQASFRPFVAPSFFYEAFSKTFHRAATDPLTSPVFFYPVFSLQILGGRLAERFGFKRVYATSLCLAAALTLATPSAARAGLWPLGATRAALGLCLGVTFPSLYVLAKQWVPAARQAGGRKGVEWNAG